MEFVVGARDVGELLGMTERNVQILAKEGVFKKVGHGQYDLRAVVQDYVQYEIKKAAEKRTDRNLAATVDYQAVKNETELKKLVTETTLKELELKKLEGELVDIEAVEAFVAGLAGMTKDSLFAMPDRLSERLADCDDAHTCRAILETEIRQLLKNFEDKAYELGTIADEA
ncbi:hypothetical protein ADMFC3_12770 [Geovibrio sp. ADMFC3]